MLAILQARMSSTRLPGKVLMPLAGAPMLLRQVERLRRSRRLTRLLVATSREASDDPLARVCEAAGLALFRGDLGDVLERFGGALEAAGRPEHFVRLTADCPLADPGVLDLCIDRHLASAADYTSNTEGWTFPKGLDVEVCRTAALEMARRDSRDPYEREHVMPFLYRRPERFRLERVRRAPPLPFRWTVDTPEDYRFVGAVYDALYPVRPDFSTEDVLAWQAGRPEMIIPNPDGAGP